MKEKHANITGEISKLSSRGRRSDTQSTSRNEIRRTKTTASSSASVVDTSQSKKGMLLPFVPLSITFDNIRYSVDMPQCYAEKQALGEVSQELLDTQVNPAVWEISGHLVLKRKKDYEEASEEYTLRLLAEISLSEERFQEVKTCVFEAASLVEFEEDVVQVSENEGASKASPVSSSRFHNGCLFL